MSLRQRYYNTKLYLSLVFSLHKQQYIRLQRGFPSIISLKHSQCLNGLIKLMTFSISCKAFNRLQVVISRFKSSCRVIVGCRLEFKEVVMLSYNTESYGFRNNQMCVNKWVFLLQILVLASALEIHSEVSQANKDKKVRINMYYSSLCPYSKRYLKLNLANALNAQGVWQIADFRLFPYGISSRIQNGTHWEFDCMHGPSECRGNLIHTCALHLYNQEYYSKAIPFITCMATIVRGWDDLGQECAKKTAVSWEKINSCSRSEKGNSLLAQMAQQTEKLSPKNTYVPWITVNDRHSQVAETDDLVEYACRRYKGSLKLKVCQQAMSCPLQ